MDFQDVLDYYEDKEWMLERIDQFEYDLAMLGDDSLCSYSIY